MKNKYSKKQLEELYNCEIFKDTGFDSCIKFWVAQGLPFTEDGEAKAFYNAAAWKHKRMQILERDHYECQDCRKRLSVVFHLRSCCQVRDKFLCDRKLSLEFWIIM